MRTKEEVWYGERLPLSQKLNALKYANNKVIRNTTDKMTPLRAKIMVGNDIKKGDDSRYKVLVNPVQKSRLRFFKKLPYAE